METPEHPPTPAPQTQAPAPARKSGTGKVIFVLVLLVIIAAGALMVFSGTPGTTDNQTPTDNDNQITGLSEDFDGETLGTLETSGWSVWYKPRMEEVTGFGTNFPAENILVENETLVAAAGAGGLMYTTSWSDFTITFSYMPTVTSGNSWAGLVFRSSNDWSDGTVGAAVPGSWPQNAYLLQLGLRDNIDGAPNSNILWEIVDKSFNQLARVEQEIALNAWHDVRVEASGSSIKVYLDSQPLFDFSDDSHTSGSIGLLHASGPVYFDNFAKTP